MRGRAPRLAAPVARNDVGREYLAVDSNFSARGSRCLGLFRSEGGGSDVEGRAEGDKEGGSRGGGGGGNDRMTNPDESDEGRGLAMPS